MSEHFIKHIAIEQYKCLRNFSAEGFQRVNLISGKNNVGKTALLEAIANNASILALSDSSVDITAKSLLAIYKKGRESEINEAINNFDDSITSVKIIDGNSIQCKITQPDGTFSYRDIGELGNGLYHYLAVITGLFDAENSYLFIDELSSDIHYSSLDLLWETILALSKELNVQVFATTHSKECIESYERVAEKLNDLDISLTTLVRNKEKAVKAINRNYEGLACCLHDEREVRGW